MVLDGLFYHGVECRLEVLGFFQSVCVNAQTFRHRAVEHDIGAGDTVGGPQHPELEFIPSESERRGPVAVGGVPIEFGKHIHPKAHLGLFRAPVGGVGLDGLQNGGQLIPQEDGDNGGRRLIRAQAMVIPGCGNREPQ